MLQEANELLMQLQCLLAPDTNACDNFTCITKTESWHMRGRVHDGEHTHSPLFGQLSPTSNNKSWHMRGPVHDAENTHSPLIVKLGAFSHNKSWHMNDYA